MVVGNGLIAKAFSEFMQDERYLFFCSGVSNSTCREPEVFERERLLLEDHISRNAEKTLIYFSTCSIEDPFLNDSMYVRHKLHIEATISARCRSYYIFRLSNVVGKTPNSTTVLNFLYNAIVSGSSFDLWENSNRNLIDVADTAILVKGALQEMPGNTVINVANPYSYDVLYIVSEIERHTGRKGVYRLVEKGIRFAISTAAIEGIISRSGIRFGHDYLQELLKKYYPA